jgi:archaeosine synthase
MRAAMAFAGRRDKVVMVPYMPMALHWRIAFSSPEVEIDAPKGVVIHPFDEGEAPEADVYVLGAAGALRAPRDLVRAVTGTRERTLPDAALYAPALATPANLAFLVYLGIDLVDSTRVVADAYYERYHTRDGVFSLPKLAELPCRCEFCRQLADGRDKDQPELTAGHNALELEEELLRVREMIRRESMREYVERQVRVDPELTAALRILDGEHRYLERRTPQFRHSVMHANTAESLKRVEVARFASRVLERYTAPRSGVLLLLPCSARKPYSSSRSHRLFAEAVDPLRRYVHELILTSPLALVPRELEGVYPAASYDVPVTGHWDREERAWLLGCLELYLERNHYPRVVAHLEGELQETVRASGLDAVYTGGGTDETALARLRSAVAEASQGAVRLDDFRRLRFRAVADYYLGSGAGDCLLSGQSMLRGRELRSGKKALATLTPSGIALTLDGGRLLEPRGVYLVAIGDFVPKGTILAPGVSGADEQIRPGDEVIVRGERAFGVGRARMSGWEMVRSRRGAAVELRQVEEI